jgi:FkbM family methyltransferase
MLRTASSALGNAALTLLLRAGQITRLLPRVRGFYKIRDFYRRVLPADLLVRTKFDKDLVFEVRLTDNVGILLWHYPDFYEKHEVDAFCSFIKPGTVVLDVGANLGLYTLLAAKRGARVFAVEADPLNAEMLRRNLRINGLEEKVTIFQMAATDTEQKVSLHRNRLNMGESNILNSGIFVGDIEGRPIDSLNLPPVDVCKMDIEGAEFMALKGMRRTAQRSPDLKLFVEYAEVFPDSKELLSYLRLNFATLRILETPETDPNGKLPEYCNILAIR